ncbi:MAG: tetratricopeptide repeat protein [Polyangiales bacterium]
MAEHARALSAAGQAEAAAAAVTEALDAQGPEGDGRTWLLRLRAELHAAAGDDRAAATDLEDALGAGDADALPALVAALDRRRLRAAEGGDFAAERDATMRLVDVLPRAGQSDVAEALLAGWTERAPRDAEALRRVGDLHASAGRWDDAVTIFQRLVQAEEGPEQVAAALRLADACERAGRPEEARDGLERAYERNRGDEGLRHRLRALYEGLAMPREAARLWMDDADFAPDEDARFERLRRAGETWLDQASDPGQAVVVLEQARALRPSDHDITVLLADAFTAAERLADASQLLNDAIAGHRNRRSKELAVLQHRMGRLAYAAADHAVEMAWLNAALDTDPQNGQVAAELADVAMELQNYEIALKALRAVALMKSPGPMSRAMAFLKQGRIAHAQGDSKRAIFLARKSLSEDANLTEAQDFLREIGAE